MVPLFSLTRLPACAPLPVMVTSVRPMSRMLPAVPTTPNSPSFAPPSVEAKVSPRMTWPRPSSEPVKDCWESPTGAKPLWFPLMRHIPAALLPPVSRASMSVASV